MPYLFLFLAHNMQAAAPTPSIFVLSYLQLDYGCEVYSGEVYSGWMLRLRLTESRPESMDFINRNVKDQPLLIAYYFTLYNRHGCLWCQVQ